MEDNGGDKGAAVSQIVRLKGFLQKWQNATLGPMCSFGVSPEISRRMMNSSLYCDSDDDNCQSPAAPPGVPKGYLAVYVGPELRRFIIPTSYLSDPLFKVLFEKVEEEFGFSNCGGLTIPCEIETFKYLLQCMENHRKEQSERNAAAENSRPVEE